MAKHILFVGIRSIVRLGSIVGLIVRTGYVVKCIVAAVIGHAALTLYRNKLCISSGVLLRFASDMTNRLRLVLAAVVTEPVIPSIRWVAPS